MIWLGYAYRGCLELDRNQVERARADLVRSQQLANQREVGRRQGAVQALCQGRLALAENRVEDAVTQLERAVIALEPEGTFQLEKNEALVALAEALAQRGGEEDRVSALLERATSAYNTIGLVWGQQRVEKVRRSLTQP